MAASRAQGFIDNVVTNVNLQLQFVDNWSALQQEWNAMGTNNARPTQDDLDAVFGTLPGPPIVHNVTLQQWTDMLTAVQTIVDSYHVPATAAKIYRFKR